MSEKDTSVPNNNWKNTKRSKKIKTIKTKINLKKKGERRGMKKIVLFIFLVLCNLNLVLIKANPISMAHSKKISQTEKKYHKLKKKKNKNDFFFFIFYNFLLDGPAIIEFIFSMIV